MALPEFIHGVPYQEYEYDHEGALVMAFTMSLLQELNGRNVANPISLLRGERKYWATAGKRADLFLDAQPLAVLGDDLASYGYRRLNWLEAKFFRTNEAGVRTVDKSKASLALLRDMIRLVTLPPEAQGKRLSARYLLHAYQLPPDEHVAPRRNGKKFKDSLGNVVHETRSFTRSWLSGIREAGNRSGVVLRLADEIEQFDSDVGPLLRHLDVRVSTTNFSLSPMGSSSKQFHFFLSRIDTASVDLSGGSGRPHAHYDLTEDGVTNGIGYRVVRDFVIEALVK